MSLNTSIKSQYCNFTKQNQGSRLTTPVQSNHVYHGLSLRTMLNIFTKLTISISFHTHYFFYIYWVFCDTFGIFRSKEETCKKDIINIFFSLSFQTVSGSNAVTSKCLSDPAIFSFRSISSVRFGQLTPVEQPPCAY